jgi:hypothetical protein
MSVNCYFTGKLAASKICVIQTFSAKIRLNLEVLELARYRKSLVQRRWDARDDTAGQVIFTDPATTATA